VVATCFARRDSAVRRRGAKSFNEIEIGNLFEIINHRFDRLTRTLKMIYLLFICNICGFAFCIDYALQPI
jgi:hypothetical protein